MENVKEKLSFKTAYNQMTVENKRKFKKRFCYEMSLNSPRGFYHRVNGCEFTPSEKEKTEFIFKELGFQSQIWD